MEMMGKWFTGKNQEKEIDALREEVASLKKLMNEMQHDLFITRRDLLGVRNDVEAMHSDLREDIIDEVMNLRD